ncbi:hypothetical protein V8D89_004762 [Ganoderma adspersum]
MRGNVKLLTSHLVLKSTPLYPSRMEAEAMRFVAEHCNCPCIPGVPRLHHYWEEGDEGRLVMDYVEGEPFQRARHQLSPAQRETVMKQLARYPLGHAMTDFAMTQMDEPCGPFVNQCDFNDWKVSRYQKFSDGHPPTVQRIAEIQRTMPDSHTIVFTHGDINRKNVLVQVKGDGPGDVERPAFWESFKWRWEGSTSEEWNGFAWKCFSAGYETDVALEEELQHISSYFTP